MIQRVEEYPKRRWWQRLLCKLFGARDLAVVVAYDVNTGQHSVMWFSGVDMERPTSVSVDGVVVPVAPTLGASDGGDDG